MVQYIKDEFGFNLNFTVKNKDDGTPFDLTGYTIKFYMWLPNEAAKISAGVCVISVAASGTCYHVVTSGSFDTPGSYNWELILTKAGVERHARSNGNIEIMEEHG
jgi:hypothetical protein